MTKCTHRIAVLFFTALLASCGGGDGKMPVEQTSSIPPQFSCPETFTCVKTTLEFQDAIAVQDSKILLLAGSYDVGVTEIEYAVEISSQHDDKARISGTSYLKILHDDVSISNLHFINGASPSGGQREAERFGSITIFADNVVIENNIFEQVGIGSTVSDNTGITIRIRESNSTTIHHNEFYKSHSIAIKVDDSSRNLNVRNNTFRDSPFYGGFGEVLQVGDAFSTAQGISPSNDDIGAIFSDNHIMGWQLERELISIKSSRNVIKNNIIENSGNAAIVVRMGNHNLISNNVIKGNIDFPVRISGEYNVVSYNFFCGEGHAISLHTERVYNEQRDRLYNSYWAARFNTISNNQFWGYANVIHINQGYPPNGIFDYDYLANPPKENLIVENDFYFSEIIEDGMSSDFDRNANDFITSQERCAE